MVVGGSVVVVVGAVVDVLVVVGAIVVVVEGSVGSTTPPVGEVGGAVTAGVAWSDDDVTEDVLPYSGVPYSDVTDSRPEVQFRHEEWQDEAPPRRSSDDLLPRLPSLADVVSARRR